MRKPPTSPAPSNTTWNEVLAIGSWPSRTVFFCLLVAQLDVSWPHENCPAATWASSTSRHQIKASTAVGG
ncbi:MAG: hypothetical protein WCD11_10800 [Solirubrobacteraceae bacterium]